MCGFVARGGGYAELALVRPELVFDVPTGVTDVQALSLLVQGLTAWHLVRTSARVQPTASPWWSTRPPAGWATSPSSSRSRPARAA